MLLMLIVVGTYIQFSNIENKQVATLFLFFIFFIISIFQDFSYYNGFGDNSNRIGEFIEKHPMLKYWLVFYCAIFLPFMVYEMRTTSDDDVSGSLYFLSLALLIGPVFIISERERYRRLGK